MVVVAIYKPQNGTRERNGLRAIGIYWAILLGERLGRINRRGRLDARHNSSLGDSIVSGFSGLEKTYLACSLLKLRANKANAAQEFNPHSMGDNDGAEGI